jgi:hypothetical protein
MMLCELLPDLAQVADKFTLVRGMHHTQRFHNSAGYYSLTGHAPLRDDLELMDTPERFPAYGSVVDRFAPAVKGMPTFIAYPYVLRDGNITAGQHASFLGKLHNPLFFEQDPNHPDFRLPELSLSEDLPLGRLEDRFSLLRVIDRQTKLLEQAAPAGGLDGYYGRAMDLLTSPAVKRAFDLSAEPAALRDRYGRTTYGQGCLLARRLVEAGVRFVNVYLSGLIGGDTGGWDTHGFNNKPMYPILRKHLLPLTNQAVSTLLTDLDNRGLLDETLVVWMGEFGRTPRINRFAGRDHWPQCYSVLVAGGGVRRGIVFGASDNIGEWPADTPVRPDDLAATMFTLLGIDPHTEVIDPLGRPLPISRGDVIGGLLA